MEREKIINIIQSQKKRIEKKYEKDCYFDTEELSQQLEKDLSFDELGDRITFDVKQILRHNKNYTETEIENFFSDKNTKKALRKWRKNNNEVDKNEIEKIINQIESSENKSKKISVLKQMDNSYKRESYEPDFNHTSSNVEIIEMLPKKSK